MIFIFVLKLSIKVPNFNPDLKIKGAYSDAFLSFLFRIEEDNKII